jgi:hypothetical protein
MIKRWGIPMASEAAEHLRRSGDFARDERWVLPDPNGDGLITISDASGVFTWFFCAPGDWLILTLMTRAPELSLFFELTPEALSGLFSSLVSLGFWLGVGYILAEVVRR